MIEVRQARYFIAIAEELHFGRAAARLQMSQPPLSQAIAALERQLGVSLMVRTTRTVSLTESGRAFLEACRTLVADAERAADVARQAERGEVGTLRIGAVTSAFIRPLPEALAIFREARPNVVVQMTEIDTDHGAVDVLSRSIDLALVRDTGTDSRLTSTLIRTDELVVALPQSHAVASSTKQIDLESLAGESWVWLPRDVSPNYHDELVAACRSAGFSPSVSHRARSINSQLAMVACGLGVTLVPDTSATSGDSRIVFRPIVSRPKLVGLAAVHDARQASTLVREFVSVLRGSGKAS